VRQRAAYVGYVYAFRLLRPSQHYMTLLSRHSAHAVRRIAFYHDDPDSIFHLPPAAYGIAAWPIDSNADLHRQAKMFHHPIHVRPRRDARNGNGVLGNSLSFFLPLLRPHVLCVMLPRSRMAGETSSPCIRLPVKYIYAHRSSTLESPSSSHSPSTLSQLVDARWSFSSLRGLPTR